MKLNKETIKNLFKKEINKDLFKITLALFLYLIVFAVFKAGYDFQSLVPIKNKEEQQNTKKIKNAYIIDIFGSRKEVLLDGDNSLLDIIQNDNQIEITRYYEGNRINQINGNKNFKIYLNDQLIKNSFLTEEFNIIKPNSTIKVTY